MRTAELRFVIPLRIASVASASSATQSRVGGALSRPPTRLYAQHLNQPRALFQLLEECVVLQATPDNALAGDVGHSSHLVQYFHIGDMEWSFEQLERHARPQTLMWCVVDQETYTSKTRI